jgi:hypothetical protein
MCARSCVENHLYRGLFFWIFCYFVTFWKFAFQINAMGVTSGGNKPSEIVTFSVFCYLLGR